MGWMGLAVEGCGNWALTAEECEGLRGSVGWAGLAAAGCEGWRVLTGAEGWKEEKFLLGKSSRSDGLEPLQATRTQHQKYVGLQ